MSPSPDLSPKPSSLSSNQSQVEPSTPPANSSLVEPSKDLDPSAGSSSTVNAASEEGAVLRKPLVRPVHRPQPAPPAADPVPAVTRQEPVRQEPVTPVPSVDTPASSTTADPEPQVAQASLRQQPIPPPSEPKQYRAIGLVRGKYTPAEDEFTRGEVLTTDGVPLKAVLLGRVMSLVRNHIDLEKEHLWVVYPRTRDSEKELHVQIVGIWEPATLKRSELEGDASSESPSGESSSGESPSGEPTEVPEDNFSDPRMGDGYFSIRGEIVFILPDEQFIVAKIQQAARKSSQKAKAFKLNLQGVLDSAKTVGYFWDLHIQRQGNTMVITEATCIGLAPPKRRSKDDNFDRRRPGRPAFGRKPGVRSGPPRPATGAPRPVNREPIAKPLKRSEQTGES